MKIKKNVSESKLEKRSFVISDNDRRELLLATRRENILERLFKAE